MSRKATITVDWKTYGLSASLDVEAPDLVTYFNLKCKEITDQGGWIKSPYDTYSHSKWYTFEIETDADNETLQAAIDNGDIQPDGYEGDIQLYTIRINKGTLSFSFAFQVSSASDLDNFYNTDIQTCDIWFIWKLSDGTVLESCFTVKIPPFGSSDLFEVPAPANAASYYHDITETLIVTHNNSKYDENDLIQWINNGSITFQPEIRHLQYQSGSSTYSECILDPSADWNQSSAAATDYVSFSFDTGEITFLKMIYYDGAIASGFKWIDSEKAASNFAVYMIKDQDGFSHTVASVISTAASSALVYSPGYITVNASIRENPAKETATITAAPTTITTSSSGFYFSNGTTSGSLNYNTCFMMIRFTDSSYASDFIQMIRSHLITLYATTNGSSANMLQEHFEIHIEAATGNNDPLEIPTGYTRQGSQINYSGFSGLNSASAITDGVVQYASSGYYYVPLFKYVEYDVPGSSSISQGVRLIYSGTGVSGTTQHSNPSYFYPSSIDAWWRIITIY